MFSGTELKRLSGVGPGEPESTGGEVTGTNPEYRGLGNDLTSALGRVCLSGYWSALAP